MLLGSGWELWQYLSWAMVVLSRRRCHLDEAEGHLAMGKGREASCFHPKHILPRQPQWSPPSDQTLLITWSSSSLVTASKQVFTKLWFTASAVVSHALVCWLLPAVSSSQLVHPLSGSGRGKYSPTGFATFSESRGLHNTRSHDPGILSLAAQTSQHHRCLCGNTQQGEKGIKYVIEKIPMQKYTNTTLDSAQMEIEREEEEFSHWPPKLPTASASAPWKSRATNSLRTRKCYKYKDLQENATNAKICIIFPKWKKTGATDINTNSKTYWGLNFDNKILSS